MPETETTMDLLFIRHGRAQKPDDADRAAKSDAGRKLTGVGRARMKRAARGLRRLAPDVDLLWTSPYVRAVQTAELVARRYRGLEPAEQSELRPSQRPGALLDLLLAQAELPATVAVVGHEPHLSRTVSWLLSGRPGLLVELKKGGACLVRFDGPPSAGKGKLLWLMSGRQLAAIGHRSAKA
jgi:phosphohistidine phosphatase